MASAVQFSTLRDLGRKELTFFLDKYSGSKVLIWDEKLTGPMDQIARYSFLKQRGVERMFRLDQRLGARDVDGVENVVYVTRPDVAAMEAVANSVKNIENATHSQNRAEFHALFVPNRSLLCDKRLQDLGVYGSFTFIDELGTFWFPLEADLISMEAPSIFADYHLDSDPTALYGVARGIMAIQSVYGVIPKVYGKGRAARQVADYMQSMRKELQGQEPDIMPQIDSAIILDRKIDLISPLITQLTYEGLIDEMFGVRNSAVSLPAERFMEGAGGGGGTQEEDDELSPSNPSGGAGRKTIHLTSNEDMYAEIRDKNFNAVGPYLSRKAKSLSAQDERRKTANTVRELKTFVDGLPQMMAMKQSLATHTSIAEQVKEETERRQFLEFLQAEQELLNFQNTDRIVDRVEEAACEEEELVRVLRVACLQSVVNSGLKPKVLESYRRTIAHSYGYKHVMSLYNLEKVGLLSAQLSTNTRNYAVLRKRLNLTLDDVDEQDPTDTAYVHSVYAPITIRLVESFSKPGGWRAIEDVLKNLLPEATVEENQPLASNLRRRNDSGEAAADRPRVVLVVFVGGCTFAEISALRFLSQQEDSNTEYLIATTAIINGNTFLRSLLTDIADPMEY